MAESPVNHQSMYCVNRFLKMLPLDVAFPEIGIDNNTHLVTLAWKKHTENLSIVFTADCFIEYSGEVNSIIIDARKELNKRVPLDLLRHIRELS